MAPPPTMSIRNLCIKARGLSQNIISNYGTLQAILAWHEATIQKRWAKKKKQQKLEILQSAWPGLAKKHRPNFALWRRNSAIRQTEVEAKSQQKHFMCPYINQEDLLKPRTLLLLLNARGYHHPRSFAGADCEAMHFGLVIQSLMPIFLNGYTMILNNADKPWEYGEVVSWDEVEGAFDWYVDRTQYMPGEGLLVLEVQHMIMDFLVAFCYKLLYDIPRDILFTDAYPAEREPLLKTEKEVEGFDSMAVMALEAPYRVPVRIDFDHIEAILCAKLSSADDYIWQLREDPGYFAEQLHETMEQADGRGCVLHALDSRLRV